MKKYTLPLYGCEVDDYCFNLIDRFGEESLIVKTLDKNYNKLISKSIVYTEQLNEIRSFLCKMGFQKEIEECDEIFDEKLDEELKRINIITGKSGLETRLEKEER